MYFGAHDVNLNVDRRILYAEQCSPWTAVSDNLKISVHLRTFPEEGRKPQNTSEVVENGDVWSPHLQNLQR